MKSSSCSVCKPKEKCALFGASGFDGASRYVEKGLWAQQHRGKESTRIVSSDGSEFHHKGGMGLVKEVYRDVDLANKCPGTRAIGHNRYSTFGGSASKNIQPIFVESERGNVAVAHNGTLVNAKEKKDELLKAGTAFITDLDTENILHDMIRSDKRNIQDAVADSLHGVQGSYSLLFLSDNEILAARDPRAIMPLTLAKVAGRKQYFVASETVAFPPFPFKYDYIKDVEAGQVVKIDDNGLRLYNLLEQEEPTHCIFQGIYFMRPSSRFYGKQSVAAFRQDLGRQLAKEHHFDADVVIGVPNSGNHGAIGYSQQSGIQLNIGYDANATVDRTFIVDDADERALQVELKLAVIQDVVKGKNVVVVDDSIVRGTTSKGRIHLLRKAGAKNIYFAITCPPHKYACYYGIDFPTTQELAANRWSMDEIANQLEVDGLGYLSKSGMLAAAPHPANHYCTACFDGNYRAGTPSSIEGRLKN